jgi:hypothetical protein
VTHSICAARSQITRRQFLTQPIVRFPKFGVPKYSGNLARDAYQVYSSLHDAGPATAKIPLMKNVYGLSGLGEEDETTGHSGRVFGQHWLG